MTTTTRAYYRDVNAEAVMGAARAALDIPPETPILPFPGSRGYPPMIWSQPIGAQAAISIAQHKRGVVLSLDTAGSGHGCRLCLHNRIFDAVSEAVGSPPLRIMYEYECEHIRETWKDHSHA